jgi:hypothetical protein
MAEIQEIDNEGKKERKKRETETETNGETRLGCWD